ncbi:MAG: uracil-xanthine permease [Clostridia bacterium]|nr:uracil-xanthine permease [Clostridia bacterium]
MNMIYNVEDRPRFMPNLVFAVQQLLAIIAATLLVPTLVNASQSTIVMDQAAALFGAGVGTLVYVLFTKRRSPVFLGSSFAFISPLIGAAGCGFLGSIIGTAFAAAVYVIIAIVIKLIGTGWVDKLLPPVIIGPTVALIGLSLCGSAVNNLNNTAAGDYNLVAILCGIITFAVTVIASARGNKTTKLIPFIIGILSGYVAASVFTVIGNITDNDYLKLINYTPLTEMDGIFRLPEFTLMQAIKGNAGIEVTATMVVNLLVLFAPVALVVFAEHIADHKNLSSVIGRDLIKDPGLDRTLLGDGVGSMAGALCGGCPNTTYGEAVGCVAISGNASIYTIITTAILCLIVSFLNPVVQFINTIPACVVGGVCIALYGFIAVSGLKMLHDVDLGDNNNLFVVSAVLVPGIGGLTLNFGPIEISSIATALIIGIVVNAILKVGKKAK